jgi:PKD repeat protein/lysophospholipase L1-like esterase
VLGDFETWACSGAVTSDLSSDQSDTSGAPWNDPLLDTPDGDPNLASARSAVARLSATSPELITIGIGGNDLGFGETLTACVTGILVSSCAEEHNEELLERLETLREDGAWRNLFAEVREAAPQAHVAVLGYSHFYEKDDFFSACTDTGVRRSDQFWINYMIQLLNDAIREEAEAAGFQYIDIYEASTGRELCQGPGDERFLHGMILNLGSEAKVWAESYHPTPFGHRIVADIVQEELANPSVTAPEVFSLQNGETVDLRYRVKPSTPTAVFSISSASGAVGATLTSPDGTTIDATTTDPQVQVETIGGTQQFRITDPASGAWKIAVGATNVPASGAEVQVISHAYLPANKAPTAHMEATPTWDPSNVQFSADSSSDTDGWIPNYFWDFGDGESATGKNVTHQYAEPGKYSPTLTVRDDDGAIGFVKIAEPIHLPETLLYEHRALGSTASEIRITDDASSFDSPYWGPSLTDEQRDPASGPSVVYVSSENGQDVLRAPDSTSAYQTIATASSISSPSWSPDWSSIAFGATDSNGPGIFTVAADGLSAPERLTTDPLGSDSPTWSPDGTELAYARTTASGASEILTIQSDGTSATVIASGPELASPDWSPDGEQIAYAGPAGSAEYGLFIMGTDGSNPSQVVTSSEKVGQPAWSRSGKIIAYTITNTSRTDIWVVDTRTKFAEALIESAGYDGAPTWQ